MLETLQKLFAERYNKMFADMDKKMIKAPLLMAEEGKSPFFEVPTVELGVGGGTISDNGVVPVELNPPAELLFSNKKKHPIYSIYRINIPYAECKHAADEVEYFNFLFDAILSKAIPNYNKTFGGVDKVRYGQFYCRGELIESPNQVGLFVELRLNGVFAGEKVLETITL